jgi:hypothetical protein
MNRTYMVLKELREKVAEAQDLLNHTAATTSVHGATSAATPNTLVQRDPAGRFKAGAPSASDDVARKAEVDAITTQSINVISTRNASVPGTDYPIGITTFVVSDVNAGWPEATGQVITFKPASYRATQQFASHIGVRNYFRRWDSNNQQWLDWHEFPVLGAVNTFLGIQRFQGRASEDHAGISLYNPDGNLVGAYFYHYQTGRLIMRKYTPSTGEIEADLWLQASEFKYRVGNNSYDIWHSGNVPIETGNWTPDLRFGGSNAGITYATRAGRYTRIGNVVFWEIDMVLTSKGSATGDATIAGLPFTSNASRPIVDIVGSISGFTLPSGTTGVVFRVSNNSNTIAVIRIGNSLASVATATSDHFSDSSVIRASGKYTI